MVSHISRKTSEIWGTRHSLLIENGGMRTSEWIQIGFAILLAAAAWIQALSAHPLPCAATMEHHFAGFGPHRSRDVGSFDGIVPSFGPCFYHSRLAYRRSLPGALLANRPILPGSEPPHRGAPSGLRPLVDATNGGHLRHLPHWFRPGFGSGLPLLLSAGAARPGCPLCCRPTRPRGRLLAGGAGGDLSLLL